MEDKYEGTESQEKVARIIEEGGFHSDGGLDDMDQEDKG